MQKQKRFIVPIVIIAVAVVVIVGAAGVYVYTQHSKTAQQKTGIIEGGLSYPSEGIPEELKVCAENINTNKH